MLLGLIAAVSVAASVLVCVATGGFAGLGWIWMLPLLSVGFFLLGIILAFLFLLLLAAVVDLNKEQKKDSRLYRKTIELYLKSALPPLRWHIKTKGMEKLPESGRFLLVCNHVSLADPVVLLRIFAGKQLAFISKRENQSMFIVGKVMHKMLCQPINRENDREALKTILKCIEILREDKASVAVFPEGYIHQDKKLHHFRSGVFKIAQRANVPIVVCTLQNTQYLKENIRRLKRTDVYMDLLTVIQPEQYQGMTTVELGNHIYEIMAHHLGPENVSTEERTTL